MRRSVLRDQSEPFSFTKENQKLLDWHIRKYPQGRQASAVMPALDIAQRQNGGWISREAIETIASTLNMPVIKVWEIATFYSMYNLEPVGKHLIQVCRTTSCWLRGSNDVFEACKKYAKVDVGKPSEDGLFSLMEVECLGACVNAPMVQINDDYYEDLDADKMKAIIEDLKSGKNPKVGPQVDRQTSAPITGAKTNLIEIRVGLETGTDEVKPKEATSADLQKASEGYAVEKSSEAKRLPSKNKLTSRSTESIKSNVAKQKDS